MCGAWCGGRWPVRHWGVRAQTAYEALRLRLPRTAVPGVRSVLRRWRLHPERTVIRRVLGPQEGERVLSL